LHYQEPLRRALAGVTETSVNAELSSGDLARATGNTVRTVRFYEEQGLLKPAVLSGGGHRRYTQEDLERLRLILDLRELGLSICDIRAFFDLRAGCDTVAEFAVRFREVLLRHLERAEARLDQLRRVRRELREALGNIQQSLPQSLAEACPCAVAAVTGPGGNARIVKLLAEAPTCCHHRDVPAEGEAGSEADGAGPSSTSRVAEASLGRS
jgi:DNA-binding transcriptional MerR regulator